MYRIDNSIKTDVTHLLLLPGGMVDEHYVNIIDLMMVCPKGKMTTAASARDENQLLSIRGLSS